MHISSSEKYRLVFILGELGFQFLNKSRNLKNYLKIVEKCLIF